MLFVIVTCRSLFWILSTISTFMLSVYALGTPKWIIGKEMERFIDTYNRTITYQDSLGLYNRCKFSKWFGILETKCYISATSFGLISSGYWKVSIIVLGAAIILLGIASLFAVASFCKQVIRRKSLMNLAGILQAFAGIFLVVAVIFFPLGWDSNQVQRLCHDKGDKATKFQLGHCSIGVAYIAAIGATIASFFCSIFSFVADKAVFSDKVQEEILEGKQLICLP